MVGGRIPTSEIEGKEMRRGKRGRRGWKSPYLDALVKMRLLTVTGYGWGQRPGRLLKQLLLALVREL